jgi:hypothetical protein
MAYDQMLADVFDELRAAKENLAILEGIRDRGLAERARLCQKAILLAHLYNRMHDELCPRKEFCSTHRPGLDILDLPLEVLNDQ